MLRTLLKQTKFQLNIKGPEKKNTYVPSQKNKNLMKCLACDEQKHKVRPLPLATKPCENILNYISKITMLNILMNQIEFLY